MNIFVYSHTHWDREWYLSQAQFQYRLIRTIDEIIELLEADNSFNTFVLDGQTSIIEDYLELRPDREPVLRGLIAAGKIAIGPWFTMPDVFIPGGESLIRNLARGREDCERFGAKFPNLGYVPDSFGHIEQMPQILRGAGIDNYVFSRGRPAVLSDSEAKREFLWRAPDGSTVIAWQLPGSYMADAFLPSPAQPDVLRRWIQESIARYSTSHHPDIVLICHGIDHCWLQRDIPEIIDALSKLFPQAAVHHGTLQDAIDLWKHRPGPRMTVYRGQLRGPLSVHELHGTLSSRIDNKLMNEQAQMFLENLAEPLDAIAGMVGKPATPWFFRKAWRLLFHNHAHDSICGCSQDRVHDEVNTRFREVIELGTDLADSALDYLNNDARHAEHPAAIVYAGLNGGNRIVDVVVRMDRRPGRDDCMRDAQGRLYPLQIDAVDELIVQHTNGVVNCFEWRGCTYIDDTAPGEVRKLTFGNASRPPAMPRPVRVSERSLDNGRIGLAINSDGTVNLTNHDTGRVISGLHAVVHDTDIGGGYHFESLPRTRRRTTAGQEAVVRTVAKGPLRAALEVKTSLRVPRRYDRAAGRLRGQSTIRIVSTFTLQADSNLVNVSTHIANTARNHRLRLLLPTGMNTREAVADASFAIHGNRFDTWPADTGQNFHPMRNMVAVEDDGTGLVFAGKGLHEYEITDAPGGTGLEITLLRSVDFVLQCCTWETPGATLRKTLRYEYALGTYAGTWRTADVPAWVAAFRNPAIANVHGDTGYAGQRERHATTGFYVKRQGKAVPADSNRSPWKPYNAERDGWRRLEDDRFLDRALPARIRPFAITGNRIMVSAFKRADDGDGFILRFWSWNECEQEVTVHAAGDSVVMRPTDLLERGIGDPGQGPLQLRIEPFEIRTVRFKPATANKGDDAHVTASNG